jgi:TonB family protein
MKQKAMRLFLATLLFWILVTGVNQSQERAQLGPVVKVSSFEMAARIATTVTPKFPKTPMPRCSMTIVNLETIIGEDGKVKSVKAENGSEELRQSAVEAVKQWTYKPYLVNGVPTTVETTVGVFYVGDGRSGPFGVVDGKRNITGAHLPSDCGK